MANVPDFDEIKSTVRNRQTGARNTGGPNPTPLRIADLAGDLGDKRILILRNHGLMTVGKTVGEAFVWMYRIETACRIQIDALAGGSELQPISETTQCKSIEQGRRMYGPGGFIEAGKEWPALLRQLERVDGTSYRQ